MASKLASITTRTVLVGGQTIDRALGQIRNSMKDSGILEHLKKKRRFITPTQRRHIFAYQTKAKVVERGANEKLKVILREYNK